MNSFENLFLHFLQDIYYAENKILKTLPTLKKAAQSPELKAAIEKHYTETQGQVKRLEQVFASFGKKPEAKTCQAIDGIMQEGDELMTENPEASAVRDAGIIANCQAVEHYEMARYGSLIAWAEEMGKNDVVSLLERTLEEEENTDEALTELAASDVNPEACQEAA
jgi:ferritin-like metal-binding protein YciE